MEDADTALLRGRELMWEGSRQIGRGNSLVGLAGANRMLKMLEAGAHSMQVSPPSAGGASNQQPPWGGVW